jgi:hypothetical protein
MKLLLTGGLKNGETFSAASIKDSHLNVVDLLCLIFVGSFCPFRWKINGKVASK